MTGIELIAKERQEQIKKHGFTVEYDVCLNEGSELALGAMMLLSVDFEEGIDQDYPNGWDKKMLCKTKKDRLAIAGALIAAEIDRLQAIESPNLQTT